MADASGLPTVGAVVVLRNATTGFERIERTDTHGGFRILDIWAGRYELTASLSGFAPATRQIDAPVDQPVSFVLRLAPYTEAVTVVSDARRDQARSASRSVSE